MSTASDGSVGDPPKRSASRPDDARAGRRILAPPSMAALAAEALRDMILGGVLRPGDRVVENQLTVELGVSRPPLREAMHVLEQQGLIVRVPRKGAVVTPLTAHDIYEIVSLREEVERLAVQLGVPLRTPERLDRMRRAFADLEAAAENDEFGRVTPLSFAFHFAVVGLAGHQRLEDVYRSLSLQMQLCMAMNRRIRASMETMREEVGRHRPLLEGIEAGDVEGTLHALTHHGQRTFLMELGDDIAGHSPESRAWLARIRAEEAEEARRRERQGDGEPGRRRSDPP